MGYKWTIPCVHLGFSLLYLELGTKFYHNTFSALYMNWVKCLFKWIKVALEDSHVKMSITQSMSLTHGNL